jgi:hypothetical protein
MREKQEVAFLYKDIFFVFDDKNNEIIPIEFSHGYIFTGYIMPATFIQPYIALPDHVGIIFKFGRMCKTLLDALINYYDIEDKLKNFDKT